jgi:hypothetical protein
MKGAVGHYTQACRVFALAAALAGCADVVAPGYYGPDDTDAGAAASSGSPVVSTSSRDPGVSDADAPTGVSTGTTGSGADGASGAVRSSGPCDLSGRWLVVLRTVTDALGTSQAAHEWYYYEIAQSGVQVTISKGLVCGKNVRALSAASGNSDFPKAWPAMMANLSDTGRRGTSMPTSGGCQVSFEEKYEVMSATESYYVDPSTKLPTASQQASSGMPGWLDWDQDGQPGYTMSITGLASGEIYMVDRTKYALAGAIAASASSFNLAVDWSSEQDVLGVNGPPILSETSAAVKDSDASQHFATFVHLMDSQATGADASICSAIRSLAPTLAPKASN